jgi:hypothetical protein
MLSEILYCNLAICYDRWRVSAHRTVFLTEFRIWLGWSLKICIYFVHLRLFKLTERKKKSLYITENKGQAIIRVFYQRKNWLSDKPKIFCTKNIKYMQLQKDFFFESKYKLAIFWDTRNAHEVLIIRAGKRLLRWSKCR